MIYQTDLIVALDFPKKANAFSLVEKLKGLPVIYKVGLELFLSAGPEMIKELVHQKKRVFLDLKFHDIPHTVAQAATQAALMQVEMFTLHLSGGEKMIRTVAKKLSAIHEIRPKILGVSVLTSFDDLEWAKVTQTFNGHAAQVETSVLGLASHALAWGTDGIVCSAQELSSIRKLYPALYTVVPGIRPKESATHDQARVMTPEEAHRAGANAIVVGRPITRSKNPRAVTESILKNLRSRSTRRGLRG